MFLKGNLVRISVKINLGLIKSYPPAEELLTINGCYGRDNQFLQGWDPGDATHGEAERPIPKNIQAALSKLSGLTKEHKEMVGECSGGGGEELKERE